MMKYRYLPHTADAKFRAYGRSLEEAFSNALLAMYNLLLDTTKVHAVKKQVIKLSARGKEALLYDFFNEFIFLIDVEGFMLSRIDELIIKKNGAYELACTCHGDHYEHYKVKNHIKSPTYNDMFIKEQKDKVIIQAVVDI